MAGSRVKLLNVETLRDAVEELMRAGCAAGRLEAAASRAVFRAVRVEGLSRREALALHEEMLAAGGEAVVAAGILDGADGAVGVTLFGALEAFRRLLGGLSARGDELKGVGGELKTALMNVEGTKPPPPVVCARGALEFGAKTFVMGILNATPDSFYDGGRNFAFDAALAAARDMIAAGVDIIDVGGESTRPGAEPVSEEEELRRTTPLIKEIRAENSGVLISIDTYKSRVAEAALAAGADIVNDISALRFDPRMARLAADTGAPVCLMHMLGTPRDMQKDPRYERDAVFEIIDFLAERIDGAVDNGVAEEKIIIDPGIGFGKKLKHNLSILKRLGEFRTLGRPILLGASRKSFIGMALGLEPPDRLEASLAAAVLGATAGADIVRVHDYRETLRAVRLADAVNRTRRLEGSDGKHRTDG